MTSMPLAAEHVATEHGGTDLDLLGRGGPRPRCHWDESVCTRTPEHVVVFTVASDDDAAGEAEAEPYCPRHYVLTLARLLELHLPACSGSAHDHVVRVGRL